MDRWTPIQVSGLAGVVGVASGFFHSMALTSGGAFLGWGQNYYGALADGTTTDRWTPVPASGMTGVVAIAAGQFHSLALKSDGPVWGWRRGDSDQHVNRNFVWDPPTDQVIFFGGPGQTPIVGKW